MSLKANLIIEKGTTFLINITVKDASETIVNLSNYTAKSQLRKSPDSSNSISFTINNGGNTGVLVLSLSSNTSETLDYGRYLYDITLTDLSNNVIRLLEGTATVTADITK